MHLCETQTSVSIRLYGREHSHSRSSVPSAMAAFSLWQSSIDRDHRIVMP